MRAFKHSQGPLICYIVERGDVVSRSNMALRDNLNRIADVCSMK